MTWQTWIRNGGHGCLTAGGKTHAAFDGRCIPAEPPRFAGLGVALRSKYTRYSSLARLVSRAPRPSRRSRGLHHRLFTGILVAAVAAAGPSAASAQSEAVLIRARTIHTVTSGTLQEGEILIRNGIIEAVGPSVDVPADARVYEARVVIPGLIDAHAHLGLDRSGRSRIPRPGDRRMESRGASGAVGSHDPGGALRRRDVAGHAPRAAVSFPVGRRLRSS